VLAQLQKDFPDSVRVVFRHFPLNGHPLSMSAAAATEAAGKQEKFWEMHDLIFAEQQTWSDFTTEQFNSWAVEQAKELGMDSVKFSADLEDPGIVEKLQAAQQEGARAGVTGTPYLLFNGKIWQGPRDIETLRAVVKLTELEKRQFLGCPPTVIDPSKQYFARLQTDKGEIVIQLFPDKAPITVNSFVFLAQNGWFDGIIFHRVLTGFVAQSGDPSGTGYGGPGYAFRNEINDLKYDKEGMVGMANAGADSNGSQFFITLKAVPELDGSYTVFGQVVQGMDVLKKLTPRDPMSSSELPPGDVILKVIIEEK
jgi:cyclophilin family peptidyl-prolyl cis-trans isomerase